MVEKTVVIRLIGDASGFVASVASAGAATTSMSNQVAAASAKANSSLVSFGKTAVRVGQFTILGVAAGLALSAKAAIDFETSFAGVRKTVETSEAGFAILEDSIRGIAKTIPIAVNELNQIAELGGQLGVGANALPEFTKTVAELGVTTVLSTQDAALGFARLDNIMQLNQRSFGQMGSTIVDLGNNFASTEDEILNFALRIAPVGKVANLSAGEILGIGTAFASVGVKAERGGTSVQKALIAITEAAQTGGAKLKIFSDVAGLSSDAFRNLVDTDPAKAFSKFVTGLQRVTVEGQNVFEILRNVGLGNTRVTQSLLAVAAAGNLIEDTLDAQEVAWRDNVALTEEAAKRFDTTASKMKLATNQVKDLAISIGQTLLPKLGSLAQGLGDFFSGLAILPEPIKAVGKAVLGMSIAMGIGGTAIASISKIMGGSLIARLGLGAVAAGGLATIIGVGLVAAVGFATGKIAENGRKQRETAGRVAELTEALKLQAQGYEDNGKAAIKARIINEGLLPSLTELGVGLNDFVDATFGNEAAIEKIGTRFTTIRERYEEFKKSIREGSGQPGKTFLETQKEVDKMNQRFETLILVEDALGVATGDLKTAQGGLLESSSQLADSMDIERGGQLYGSVLKESTGITEDFSNALDQLGVSTKLSSDNISTITDGIEEYRSTFVEAFNETRDSITDQTTAWDALGAAVIINVDKILARRAEQVEIISEFEQLVNGLNLSGTAETELRQDFGDTLENQKALVKFINNNPINGAKLIKGYEDSAREIEDVAFILYTEKIPRIVREAGPKMFEEFSKIVDDLVENEEMNPATAWRGVIERALKDAPPDIRNQLVTALRLGIANIDPGGDMIGADLLNGIIRAILTGTPRLERALDTMTSKIITRTKTGLEISSPSHVFARIGRSVVDGFAMGITDNMDKLSGFGPQALGIPNRHQLIGGSTTNTSNAVNNNFDLSVNGSTNVSDDAKSVLLAAQVIGAT